MCFEYTTDNLGFIKDDTLNPPPIESINLGTAITAPYSGLIKQGGALKPAIDGKCEDTQYVLVGIVDGTDCAGTGVTAGTNFDDVCCVTTGNTAGCTTA
jgi:hypothetical protein